jgi:elongation factor 1-beta
MAEVIATLKIMPESPEVNLDNLELKAKEKIKDFIREDSTMKVEVEPVAFGLKAVNITFVMDEALGSPDALAEDIEKFEDVTSAEITDVRRALG